MKIQNKLARSEQYVRDRNHWFANLSLFFQKIKGVYKNGLCSIK